MNMNKSPTKEQLRALISACNDTAGHHVLWVSKNGNVFINTVPDDLSPAGFEYLKPEMQMRYYSTQLLSWVMIMWVLLQQSPING